MPCCMPGCGFYCNDETREDCPRCGTYYPRKELKFDNIISQLRELYSIKDDILYANYSQERLNKELKEIEESIFYLEQNNGSETV